MSSELAERAARAAERAEAERAPSWNPREQAGHPRLIAGQVLERRLRLGMGFEGADVETVLIHTPASGDWLVWLFGAVLVNEFAGIRTGDVVAIKYEGHNPGGRGTRGYEAYRVTVDQATVPAGPAPTAPVERAVAIEPEPAAVVAPPPASPACASCAAENGRHAAGCPERASETCGECGFHGGHHREGCPSDIPF